MMMVLFVLTQVLYAIFLGLVLMYIVRLEIHRCECSKDWKRDFIKYYLIVYIPMFLSMLLIQFPVPLLSVVALANIVYIFVVFAYIKKLQRNNCKCSIEKIRNVLEIVNYIQIALFVLSFVALFFVSVFAVSADNNVLKMVKNTKRQ